MSRVLARFAARVIGPDRPHDRVAEDAGAVVGPDSVVLQDDPGTPVPAILEADAAGNHEGVRVVVHPRSAGTLVTVSGDDAAYVAHAICTGSRDGRPDPSSASVESEEDSLRFWRGELDGAFGAPSIGEAPETGEEDAAGVAKGRVPREALGANPVAALVAAVAACTGSLRDSVVGVVPETGPATWTGQPLPVRVRPGEGQSREDAAADAIARISEAGEDIRRLSLPDIASAVGGVPFPVVVVIREPLDCGGARAIDDRAPVPEFCLAGIDAVVGGTGAVSLSVRARGGQAGARSLLSALVAAIEGASAEPSSHRGTGSGGESAAAPAGEASPEILDVLCSAVAEVLDLPGDRAPGPDDDFFRLGGDSMAALRLSATLASRGASLEVRSIFENPVLGELALLVRDGASDGVGPDAAGGAAEGAASTQPMSASGLSAEQLASLLGEENR